MAVSAAKTWVALEVLTASDLNAEFANIYDNGEDLGHPRTKEFRMDGNELKLNVAEDTSITSDNATTKQMDLRVAGSDIVAIYSTSPWMTINGIPVATTTAVQEHLVRLGTMEARIAELNSNAVLMSQLDNF
jgi:hypothetical protein